jgi:hypothetical protein
MNKRIRMVVVLFALVAALAGAYALGSQQSAQTCSAAHDVLIVSPAGNANSARNGYTVDTFTTPAFDHA